MSSTADEAPQPTAQVGALWHWRRGDALPPLTPPAAEWRVHIFRTGEADAVSSAHLELTFGLASERSHQRFRLGHRIAVGFLSDQPVAYGWVAVGAATFGEPAVAFHVPSESAYLYDFVTLAAWRGRGCYPALLQGVIAAEPARDFWIIHHITNIASQRGIDRAGFRRACAVYYTTAGGVALAPDADPARAEAGATLLGLPLLPAH